MAQDSVGPPGPVDRKRLVYRWDLDKTYLRTDFDTLKDLWRRAIERPADKRTVPGAAPLLREILGLRVRDGVILRLIGKWLNAGVMEGLELSHPEAGTPQGGVISPLLANVYLHEVLDEWYVNEVRPRLQGRAALVRYADDFVFVFERKEDAERVLDVLPKRFGKYGLRLHPEKTRLVRFNRPSRNAPPRADAAEPESFDLLGHSMGGMVAQVMALAAPERVRSLVLMDTSHGTVTGLDPAVVALAVGVEPQRPRGVRAPHVVVADIGIDAQHVVVVRRDALP